MQMSGAEVMSVIFLPDVSAYFFGSVRQASSNVKYQHSPLHYAGSMGRIVEFFIRLHKRRLSHIAKRWMAIGIYGKKNLDLRISGFTYPSISPS
jgi:hypothetical protein